MELGYVFNLFLQRQCGPFSCLRQSRWDLKTGLGAEYFIGSAEIAPLFGISL